MSASSIINLSYPEYEKHLHQVEKFEKELFLELLALQQKNNSLLLKASSFNEGQVFIKSFLIPKSEISKINFKTTPEWDIRNDNWQCGLVHGGGKPPRVEFNEPSLRICGVDIEGAKHLIHLRHFDGLPNKNYYEVPQFLLFAHDLHWVRERNSWCRLDTNGDIESVIKVQQDSDKSFSDSVVSINREIIELQMAATDNVLLQVFDYTYIPKGFSAWQNVECESVSDDNANIFYKSYSQNDGAGFIRGYQIVYPKFTSEELGAILKAKEDKPKEYVSFIINDFKNHQTIESSCDPKATASYFQLDSNLPFQTSPVFFNASVLDKYKSDPEKYTLENRSISCRNSWYLREYDFNEAGQIHTLICDLADLPFQEQVYWKSFNEPPKGAISKRTFLNSFLGKFDGEPDNLRDLKDYISHLDASNYEWFKLHEPSLINQIHYPLTNSQKIWIDTILLLAKVVVESIEKSYLKRIAKDLNLVSDPSIGSIKLLKEILSFRNTPPDVINEATNPLLELNNLRVKLAAHSSGEEAQAIKSSLLSKHKTPHKHIEAISFDLLTSLKIIEALFKPEPTHPI